MRINNHTKTGLVIAGAVAIALCAPMAAQAHCGHGGGGMSMGMHEIGRAACRERG